jgi:branched-chain amino acid transport system ATP-binding protein
MSTTPLLELDAVDASYGPFRALFGVSLEVGEGEAVALLGTNGAGKTTVARVCTGLITPTQGHVRFDGQDLTGRRAYEFARSGVSHAPEGRSVFASLTVEENLTLAFREVVGRAGTRASLDTAYELFPRLSERRRQLAGSLSGGEQRMLALARVLVHPPRLLVVDELSLGLAPIIIDDVYRNLAQLREKGVALVVVEQQVEHALELADRVVVLSRGEVSYDGPVLPVDELAPHFLPEATPTNQG